MDLGAAANQAAQRRRILRVVLCRHPRVGFAACRYQRGLVALRQLVPLLLVDEGQQRRAAFPESRVVVVLRDLVEAEFLVVVGTDPFGGVDGAFLERRIDVRPADQLRHDAQLGEDQPRHAADAELEALQVGDRLDLLAEPAAHLAAGIACRDRDAAVLLEQRLHRLAPAAEMPPGVVLAGIHAEAHRGAKRERRILAEVVIGRRVPELHGARLHGVEHLQRRDDLAGGKGADGELSVGDLAHAPGDQLGAAVQRVEALRPARGEAPLDARLRLGDGRRGDCAGGDSGSSFLKK